MSVRRDVPLRQATRELAIEHMGEGLRVRFGARDPCVIPPGEIVEKRGYAEVVPTIQTVRVGPTGELWVERFAIGEKVTGSIDVFASNGAYLGTLPTGSVAPVILLPEDRVGVMEKNEFDVERLVVLAVER